jgi:hypothetical protein
MKQKEEWQRRLSERRSLYLFAGFLLSAIEPRDSLVSGISSPVRSFSMRAGDDLRVALP